MTQPIGKLPVSETESDVVAFCKTFGLIDTPTFLQFQNFDYGSEWCHVSSKHRAMTDGGKRVHGWALWEFPEGIMGDFHSVWENPEGELIDVTPPKFGASQVLFVRDRVSEIYIMDGTVVFQTNRMSPPNSPFWFKGKPCKDQVWGIPDNHPPLLKYCADFDFLIPDLETTKSFG